MVISDASHCTSLANLKFLSWASGAKVGPWAVPLPQMKWIITCLPHLAACMTLAGDPFMFLSCQGPACNIRCCRTWNTWCHYGIWRRLAWPSGQHGWLVLSCTVATVLLLVAGSDHLFLKNGVVMKGVEEGVSQSNCTASWNQRGILYWKYIPVFEGFYWLQLTLILRRSRMETVWFYTSTSNKRAAWPKLYTKSLTRDLKHMYSRFTLVRISINL